MFDYDGVYDDIQAQRVQPKKEEKLARKSRYIEGLLDKAKEREREQDIVYERKCVALGGLPARAGLPAAPEAHLYILNLWSSSRPRAQARAVHHDS